MTLFLDVDVVEKLASYNLLEEGVRGCGFELDQVTLFETARFKLCVRKNQAKGRRVYGEEIHNRICEFVNGVQRVVEAPHSEDTYLYQVPGIDAGEAIMFSLASRDPDSTMATGDKRCLRALAASSECQAMVQRLEGRILCLEQVLLCAIDRVGFEEARTRITDSPRFEIDTAVKAAFGSRHNAEEHNACGSLERRVRELFRDVGPLLFPLELRYQEE